MSNLHPEFIESFVKTCFDQGLTEEQTTELLDSVEFKERFNDENYANGFAEAMNKAASEIGSTLPEAVGDAGMGGLFGSIVGGILATHPRFRRFGRLGALGRGMGIGAGVGAAGNVAGNKIYDALTGPSGPPTALPDFLRGGQSDIDKLFPSSNIYGIPSATRIPTEGSPMVPDIYKEVAREQRSIDKMPYGLDRTMRQRDLSARTRDLQSQIRDSREDLRDDLERVQNKLSDPRFKNLSSWMAASERPGLGGGLRKVWNTVTFAEERARRQAAEYEELRKMRDTIRKRLDVLRDQPF